MEINPFDYRNISYDDYLNAIMEDETKNVTTVKIVGIQRYKYESQLPKVENDTTCKTFVVHPKKEEIIVEEKPKKHIYATSTPGICIYHTIKKGDTLDSIAKSYNVTVISIMKLNKIRDKRNIKKGQVIKVL